MSIIKRNEITFAYIDHDGPPGPKNAKANFFVPVQPRFSGLGPSTALSSPHKLQAFSWNLLHVS